LPRKTAEAALARVLAEARACRLCAGHLPLGPRPVLRASVTARL
jgi:uracil-DNA glycosylase